MAIKSNLSPHFTADEVARRLRVSIDTIHRLLKRKKLRGLRVGNRWRISYDDLRSFEEGQLRRPPRPSNMPVPNPELVADTLSED
jgi:excisionase family DNA binding protein